jgi:hypothetical protein
MKIARTENQGQTTFFSASSRGRIAEKRGLSLISGLYG